MSDVFRRAKGFIYRNARPLDLARWQYHFENGTKEAVLNALSYYQNDDGGFGHALEPDAWNPNSSPIQTWAATEILREIDFLDNSNPVINGILRYLENGSEFDGHFWNNTVTSNNDYPHAPWWHTESDSTCHNDYNPTACLAGFIIRYADRSGNLYTLGRRIAGEAFDAYIGQGPLDDMHTGLCYIRLLQYVEEAGVNDIFDIGLLKTRLVEQVKRSITRNTDEWETSYICKPSQFFNTRDSIFYKDNKDIADFECEHILKTQLDDGSWIIPWSWSDYQDAWAVTQNWWKSNGILLNILYLKGFGKI